MSVAFRPQPHDMVRRTNNQEALVEKLSVNDAPHRIGVAVRELRRGAVDLRAKAFPKSLVTGQLYDALSVLVIEYPEGCRMSDLAAALRVDASTATRAVDRLVAAGWAERNRPPDDARSFAVEATKEGIDLLLTVAVALSPEYRKRLANAFSEREQKTLARLLERLIQAFDDA